MERLIDRPTVIAGAGAGRAMALRLPAEGARAVASDASGEGLAETASLAAGDRLTIVGVDVAASMAAYAAGRGGVASFAHSIAQQHGR
ncbi:NAD(P)-dependent dehydrogenase (short-subunit alcohol dehydrogenase family) [Thermocatellispora tengchongensis]|uniref:NAD(P)-dependent dehydrogenase (Short-subunit alcohol dehydrogenase family) n=1 Tax=Thermocatellispora tengchongensis TaxID=1073253 RepID=A0A840PPW2_9ACTN|nr:hypothetical protein [Thermocatellispora tengchongensis]MBB5139811.1 NAD(P)-dependent dehydrogenase (short-subunit alcohol dehydrogenase family) [Thermocatellispora tengchongensis]